VQAAAAMLDDAAKAIEDALSAESKRKTPDK
jgi:hypothetical protein